MIRPEKLWEIAGGDPELILRCPPATGKCFRRIGEAILVVSLLSFIAAGYVFVMLSGNWFTGGLFALFFAGLISLIYKLALSALRKPTLSARAERSSWLAMTAWFLFLSLMATITANVLAVLLLTNPLNTAVQAHRQRLLVAFEAANQAYYRREIRQLEREIASEKDFAITEGRISLLQEKLAAVRQKEAVKVQQMNMQLRKAPFFTYRLSLLYLEYSGGWVFTVFVWGLFLLPLMLQQFMLRSGSYYDRMREVDYNLVTGDYERFKAWYRQQIRIRYGLSADYSEPYEDPPLNTRRKQLHYEELPEAQLLSILYEKP